MASCMECIHFNPCNMHEKIIVEKPTDGNDWELHNQVENECKYFTPTADVVEVVHCKDCKHYEIGKSYTPYCNNVMNLFEEMKCDDYCSYGERK